MVGERMSGFFRLFSSVLLLSSFVADTAWCQNQAGCLFSLLLPLPSVLGQMAGNTLSSGSSTKEKRTTRGIQFELFMLDAVGNRYPASQKYIATGETQLQKGDIVDYATDAEKLHFAEGWSLIDGVESVGHAGHVQRQYGLGYLPSRRCALEAEVFAYQRTHMRCLRVRRGYLESESTLLFGGHD
jgi:hypothetical protein